MKAPVREVDDNGSMNYAPKKLGRPEQDQNPDKAGPKDDFAPPPNMPESSEPPWKQRKQRGAFAGNIASGELRTRLTLTPDRVPEPRSPDSADNHKALLNEMRSRNRIQIAFVSASSFSVYQDPNASEMSDVSLPVASPDAR